MRSLSSVVCSSQPIRALHHLSTRSERTFAAVNCAAIPENLLEAELFGYRKGAFTDARQDHKGLFEACGGGTLFLDEIGEMPLNLQSKLLRVVQEKVVTPLGSTAAISVDTRIVAATHRNLMALVKSGQFREDLFYRLSILQIEAPPLRDRIEDVEVLVEHILADVSSRVDKSIALPSSTLIEQLKDYDWPGNIRELQNAIERGVVLSDDGRLSFNNMLDAPHTPLSQVQPSYTPTDLPLTDAKDSFEKRYLESLLRRTHGNVAHASRIAGRIRTDMYRLFSKHDLDPSDYKS